MIGQTIATPTPATTPVPRGRAISILFAFALFVSAFLLFVLEPMVAKSMLPKLGGTPMVWNTCVMFFQAALVVGYLAAHVSVQPGRPGWFAWLYPALIAAAAVALPLAFTRVPTDTDHPVAWLLGELVRVAALPTIALSMTAPALQAWFARTRIQGSDDPYFLYAASNAGSFLALLAYPTIIEPTLGLQPQARVWVAAYALLAVAVAACAFLTLLPRGYGRPDSPARLPTESVVGTWQRVRWMILAFIPSSLMLGVTTYISTDIAAVPFVWVLPLALYLGTFVAAFGGWAPGAGALAERRIPLIATVVAILLASDRLLPIQIDVPLHLALFTAVAMMCHGRLAAERPSTRHLTEFYLLISVAGMMGGVFNTLIAPLVFDRIAEYPLVLICALAVPALDRREWRRDDLLRDLGYAAVMAAAVAALHFALRTHDIARLRVATLGVCGLVAFSQSRKAPRFALLLGAMIVAAVIMLQSYGTVLEAKRTFFGSYHVTLDAERKFHVLYHGTTLHGMQMIDPAGRQTPLVYYERSGPVGQAFMKLPRLHDASDIAVVGLGIGGLSAYTGESQRWTFYEIDPAVERIARDTRYFHFLESCSSRCAVVLGDARLSLARSDKQFDAIVLDAFSSDAIPVHLLTREALQIYLQHLKPGGLLIFHISNRYLRLGPPLERLVADRGLMAVEEQYQVDAADIANGKTDSDWVVASADTEAIRSLTVDARWVPLVRDQNARVWTDDYSNIFSALSFHW